MRLLAYIIASLWLSAAWCPAVVVINSFAFSPGGSPPPPGGDTYFSSVTVLLHFNGSDGSTTFTDNSGSPKTVTASGNAQIDTAQKKYGTGSMQLDGSGDYATVSSSSAMNFGTSTDFTVEAWVYVKAGGQSDSASKWITVSNRSYYFGLYSGFIIVGNGIVNTFFNNTNYASYVGKWTHVAHTRSGTTHRVFLDGVLKATATSSDSYGATNSIYVGQDPSPGPGAVMDGWIDDVRITKGVCRYTADFTAPTSAHPDS